MQQGYYQYYYYSPTNDCEQCPLKSDCCGNGRYKQLSVSAFRNYYQRIQLRLENPRGQRMKKRRSATVEPVFGSLLHYYGLRRSHARGKAAAHKNLVLASTAYNLQKYVAFGGGPKAKLRALARMAREIFLSLLPNPG